MTPSQKRNLAREDTLVISPSPENQARLGTATSFADVLAQMPKDEQVYRRPALTSQIMKEDLLIQHLDLKEAVSENGRLYMIIFAVTKYGHTVCVRVTGFRNYILCMIPDSFTEEDAEGVLLGLVDDYEDAIWSVEIVTARSGSWAKAPHAKFLKICFHKHSVLEQVRKEYNRGTGKLQQLIPNTEPMYNSTDYTTRFLADNEIYPLSWMRIRKGRYQIVEADEEQLSTCQIECITNVNGIDFLPYDDSNFRYAPLRILSFDIETSILDKTKISSPDRNEIIQIGSMISTLYNPSEPLARSIMTLGTCSPISGVKVESFATEKELLEAWREFVLEHDPDIITGYNISRFDFRFIVNRALKCKVDHVTNLGRLRGMDSRLKCPPVSEIDFAKTPRFLGLGRIIFDVMFYVLFNRSKKSLGDIPRAHSLGNVSKKLLDEDTKEDVSVNEIDDLQSGTPEDRRRLAIYCLKDCFLPLKLIGKLDCFNDLVSQIRGPKYNGIPFNSIMNQQPSSHTMARLRESRRRGYCLPDPL